MHRMSGRHSCKLPQRGHKKKQKSGVQFGQCHVNSFSPSRYSSSIADNVTSVFSADESSRRETLRGRLSGSSVSQQLMSVATFTASEITESRCSRNSHKH